MLEGGDHELAAVLSRALPDRAAARAALDGETEFSSALWQRLVQIGLPGLVLPDELGGGGAGLAEAAAAAEALGRVAAPLPTFAMFLAGFILRISPSPYAPALARLLIEGKTRVGACLSAASGLPRLDIDERAGETFVTASIPDVIDATFLDVLLLSSEGSWWALDLRSPACSRVRVASLDPTRPLTQLTVARGPVTRVSDCQAERVLAAAWVLLAAEAIGAARAALDLASSYARQRHQFGQPIGTFQAIKHKLADDLLEVERARSALDIAVRSVDADGVPSEAAARVAKVVACAAAPRITGDAIQVHGAIGNTWEHDLHILLRRAKSCELVLDSPDLHREHLEASILSSAGSAGPARHAKGADVTELEREIGLDEDDRAFVQELRSWLDEHLTPGILDRLRSVDQTGSLHARREWQNLLAGAGLAGIHWPASAGGRDASIKKQVLYHLEMASRGLPPLIGNRGLSLIGPTLIAHRSPAQRDSLLEATRRGRILWASGLSEREAGSDLASLRTRAVINGSDLVVTGHKIWTTSAQYADWLFALVRTGPQVPKHAGITCVLIPLTSSGISVRPIRRMTGSADFNEVFLDEVRVPLANVVGEINGGWAVARTTLSHEHLTNFLGVQMRQSRIVNGVVKQLSDRVAAGQRVDHGLRRRIMDAWINAQLLQAHGMRLVNFLGAGQDPGSEGSLLKLFGQEEERRLFELAVDVQGAAGLQQDRWATAFLSTRASTVGGGTSEIHRNKIAENLLGMPRDPWADDEPSSRTSS